EGLRWRCDNLWPLELDQIRLFIEAADILAVTDDIRELVETNWPCLSKNFLLRSSKSSRQKSVSAIPLNARAAWGWRKKKPAQSRRGGCVSDGPRIETARHSARFHR